MKIYVAIPAQDEHDWIFTTLRSLAEQRFSGLDVWVCVNNPESWWDDSDFTPVCERNVTLLESLGKYDDLELTIIDKSSRGAGWAKGKSGVGMARRTLMDAICENADEDDVILSLDADTRIEDGYLQAVEEGFRRNAKATGLSAPYIHILTGDEVLDRAMLRYEIYLRYYALNMRRTGSPYTFTAIGSSMACPVWAYKKAGGMVPRESGEDFYFLQQLQKIGNLIQWIESSSLPGVRKSSRVPFGTGRAITDGIDDNWSAYPIIRHTLYNDVRDTVRLFPNLFEGSIETPMSEFLRKQLNVDDPFEPLRKNFKECSGFVRACHERIDGLRIFQYLRSSNRREQGSDEAFLHEYMSEYLDNKSFEGVVFARSSISELDELRNILMNKENEERKRSEYGSK